MTAVEKTEDPPPALNPVQLGKVSSLRGTRRALVRITQAMLDGRITPKVANCAIFGLTSIGRILEVELLERRLEDLEQVAGIGDQPTRSGFNGRRVGHA